MKPTRHSTNKYVRIHFEDIGELTAHLKELSEETKAPKSTYNDEQWDDLCQRHGIDGDLEQNY